MKRWLKWRARPETGRGNTPPGAGCWRMEYMPRRKMLEALAVDPQTPLLVAVLDVLNQLEREAVERAYDAREALPRDRAAERGAALADAQEEILKLVEEGNREKEGRGEGT